MVEFWVLGYVCGIVVQVDAVSLRVGTSSLTSSYTSMEIAMFLAILQPFSLSVCLHVLLASICFGAYCFWAYWQWHVMRCRLG